MTHLQLLAAYLVTHGVNCRCKYPGVPAWNPAKCQFEIKPGPVHAAADIDLDKLTAPVLERKRVSDTTVMAVDVMYATIPLKDGGAVVYGVAQPDTYLVNVLKAGAVVEQENFVQTAKGFWQFT